MRHRITSFLLAPVACYVMVVGAITGSSVRLLWGRSADEYNEYQELKNRTNVNV